MDTFLPSCILVTPAEILQNRSAKQHIFLQYYRYLIAEYLDIILPDIPSSYLYLAISHII